MGVKGLEALVEALKWGEIIDIKEEAQRHFEKHGERLTFVVDGSSFLHLVLQRVGPDLYLYGFYPQPFVRELNRVLDGFLKELNVSMVFFLDGCLPVGKELEVAKRHRHKRVLMEEFFVSFEKAAAQGGSKNGKDIVVENFYDERLDRYSTCTVPMLREMYLQVLESKKVEFPGQMEIIRTLLEADHQTAKYCLSEKTNLPKENVYVLAHDTDYLIYDSVLKYVPTHSLSSTKAVFEGTPGEFGSSDLLRYCVLYDKHNFVQEITNWVKQESFNKIVPLREMTIDLLADYGCIAGNDFFSCASIHEHIKAEFGRLASSVLSAEEQKQILSKSTGKQFLIMWFLLCHPGIPFKEVSSKQGGKIIDLNEQFSVAAFPQRISKSWRMASGHLKDYEFSRNYHRIIENASEKSKEDDYIKDDRYIIDKFIRGALPLALQSPILRRFQMSDVLLEPNEVSTYLYLSPLRRTFYATLFYKLYLYNCQISKELISSEQFIEDRKEIINMMEFQFSTYSGNDDLKVDNMAMKFPVISRQQKEYLDKHEYKQLTVELPKKKLVANLKQIPMKTGLWKVDTKEFAELITRESSSESDRIKQLVTILFLHNFSSPLQKHESRVEAMTGFLLSRFNDFRHSSESATTIASAGSNSTAASLSFSKYSLCILSMMLFMDLCFQEYLDVYSKKKQEQKFDYDPKEYLTTFLTAIVLSLDMSDDEKELDCKTIERKQEQWKSLNPIVSMLTCGYSLCMQHVKMLNATAEVVQPTWSAFKDVISGKIVHNTFLGLMSGTVPKDQRLERATSIIVELLTLFDNVLDKETH